MTKDGVSFTRSRIGTEVYVHSSSMNFYFLLIKKEEKSGVKVRATTGFSLLQGCYPGPQQSSLDR
jgi:hypothetical protein